jgi:hypothetical protein
MHRARLRARTGSYGCSWRCRGPARLDRGQGNAPRPLDQIEAVQRQQAPPRDRSRHRARPRGHGAAGQSVRAGSRTKFSRGHHGARPDDHVALHRSRLHQRPGRRRDPLASRGRHLPALARPQRQSLRQARIQARHARPHDHVPGRRTTAHRSRCQGRIPRRDVPRLPATGEVHDAAPDRGRSVAIADNELLQHRLREQAARPADRPGADRSCASACPSSIAKHTRARAKGDTPATSAAARTNSICDEPEPSAISKSFSGSSRHQPLPPRPWPEPHDRAGYEPVGALA